MYEERREVVTDESPATEVRRETVVDQPQRNVVEESPAYVNRGDPVRNTVAASSLINTIIWAIVVIVILVVGILVLLRYGII